MNPDPEDQPACGSVVLGEFSVSSAPGNERGAAERVAALVRQADVLHPTDLSPARLEELKTSVAEAVQNAMEHGNQYRPDLPVRVSVIVSEGALVVRIADRGVGGPRRHLPSGQSMGMQVQAPDLAAKLAGEQPPRGWGLYLIAQMTDDVRILNCAGENVVELVWYLEEVGGKE
jgi:anti-sigma regulatory factor (Ser/Thr protein kinase)